MSVSPPIAPYEAVLVPALQRIQHEYGYLDRKAMEKYSDESGIPLYRMQAVASFFPHFELNPPKAVTVRVCRDMACHINGSAKMIKDLTDSCGEDVEIRGASCLGRCDRPIAASVTVRGEEHEQYYLGRSIEEMKSIVDMCQKGKPPKPDHDADLPYSCRDWIINPYPGMMPDYSSTHKAVAVRTEALLEASKLLQTKFEWNARQLEQFRNGVTSQLHGDYPIEAVVAEAVKTFLVEDDWAKGPTLGGWSDAILKEISAADLRGMGGAGIPNTQKLQDVRDALRVARRRGSDERGFIVVNGDESEPGTFKDREILLRAPHVVVEGVILAGLITEATQGFIYIRHEYGEQIEACRKEIKRAEDLGLCGPNASVLGRPFPISVFPSPGGYICGEQSALIEAMSDRRGEPRNMPPKLETNGLDDMPTIVSNVETYGWIPTIWLRGGKTYADHGVNTWKGRRFFSISGDVNRPGVYEVPMGMTLRELIHGDQYCQGMLEDRRLKAFAPSGPSGGFLPAKLTGRGLPRDHVNNKAWQALAARRGIDPATGEINILDLELELNLFRALSPTQALGAGVVVYAEGRDMVVEALNSLEFYRNESCGKCVPCRVGSQKVVSLATHLVEGKISADRWNSELLPLLVELGKAIELASICGLGRSVPVPLRTAIGFFEQDLLKYLRA